jgi:hypothetical protein
LQSAAQAAVTASRAFEALTAALPPQYYNLANLIDNATTANNAAVAAITAAIGTTPIPPTPPSGKPGPSNTGPRVPTTAWTGSNTFTKAGTISAAHFLREVISEVPEGATITFVDCYFDGNNNFYNLANSGGGNVVCQNCELVNVQASANFGPSIKMIACNIHEMDSDAGHLNTGVDYEACWIHDYSTGAGVHGDGAQCPGGQGPIVNGCTIDGTVSSATASWSNSGVFINGQNGAQVTAPVITNNWFEGGSNFAIYLQSNQSGAIITGNKFASGKFQFGVLSNPKGNPRPAQWSSNTELSTGAVIPLPPQT